MTQINQYTNQISTMVNESFLDVDHWTGTEFQSSKILWSDFITNIPTIYTGNSALSGNREVDLGVFDLGFTGNGNIGINIAGTAATDKLHVDGIVRMNRLKSGVSSFLAGGIRNELGGMTRIATGLHIGSNTQGVYNGGGTTKFSVETNVGECYFRLSNGGTETVYMTVEDPTDFSAKALLISASNLIGEADMNVSFGTGNVPPAGFKLYTNGGIFKADNILSSVSKNTFLDPSVQNEFDGRTRIADGLHIGTSTQPSFLNAELAVEAESGQVYVNIEGAGSAAARLAVRDYTNPATLKNLNLAADNIYGDVTTSMSLGTGVIPPTGFRLYTDGGIFKSDNILSSDSKDTFLHADIENEFDGRTRIADGLHIGPSPLAAPNSVPLAVHTGASYFTFESTGALSAAIRLNNTLFNSFYQRDLEISSRNLILDCFNTTFVGSSTSNVDAIFECVSTTKGVRFPEMTQVQRDAISAPGPNLWIYNLTTNKYNFYDGTAWREITST